MAPRRRLPRRARRDTVAASRPAGGARPRGSWPRRHREMPAPRARSFRPRSPRRGAGARAPVCPRAPAPRRAAPRGAASYLPSDEGSQELQIVFKKQTQIVHPIAQHGQPLDTGAEGIARVALRVDTAGGEYARVHHAATGDLKPAGLLADTATAALAQHTGDVDLGRGFGEWKIRGAQPHRQILLEERFHEAMQDPPD